LPGNPQASGFGPLEGPAARKGKMCDPAAGPVLVPGTKKPGTIKIPGIWDLQAAVFPTLI